MSSGIFLIEAGGGLVEMHADDYELERGFQELLAEYPDLLPGDQIDKDLPRKWVLVAREQLVRVQGDPLSPLWRVDHVFVDQEGIPTLVEVKRGKNPELRREVIGQMLDYAANANSYWSADVLETSFQSRCIDEGKEPTEVLRGVFGDDCDYDAFWATVNRNLKDRRIRLLFVSESVPMELQRVVEFLNEEMKSVEVLAIEIKRYSNAGGSRAFVARVIGQTAVAVAKPAGVKAVSEVMRKAGYKASATKLLKRLGVEKATRDEQRAQLDQYFSGGKTESDGVMAVFREWQLFP
jgi:hypothetical protein